MGRKAKRCIKNKQSFTIHELSIEWELPESKIIFILNKMIKINKAYWSINNQLEPTIELGGIEEMDSSITKDPYKLFSLVELQKIATNENIVGWIKGAILDGIGRIVVNGDGNIFCEVNTSQIQFLKKR